MPSATWSRPLLALAGLAGLALAVACSAPEPAAPPPNILLVTLDTLRQDHVGLYHDGESLTPFLDVLAADGLVHDAAYTTMPTTGPAHLSIFTGLHPSRHGATRNGDPLASNARDRELARRLAEAGYHTAAFVTSPVLARSVTGLEGFEIYDGSRQGVRPGREAVEAALAWLDAEPRRPVFLWVHLYDIHSPYGREADKHGQSLEHRYGWVDPTLYRGEAPRQEMAELYADGVRATDGELRKLVSGVRERLEQRPLIVVASDHGESLDEHLDSRGYGYDHGEFLDPETIRVPLVIVGPGVEAGRSPGLASLRDLYTTLLAAAGVDDPTREREGRRDLRRADATPRIVEIERRSFRSRVPAIVHQHGGAATDGTRLVVVDEAGSITVGAADATPELLEHARDSAERAHTAAPGALDAKTRDALRALGYAE